MDEDLILKSVYTEIWDAMVWVSWLSSIFTQTSWGSFRNLLNDTNGLTAWDTMECMCKCRTVCLEIGKKEDVEVGKCNKRGPA